MTTITSARDFPAAAAHAKTTVRQIWPGLINDPAGTNTITIPAGEYVVTDLDALIGRENQDTKARGLRFQGAGSDMTHVVFSPDAVGALATNRKWNNVTFEGVTFSTTVPGSTFLHSVSDGVSAVQEYTFRDVKWFGPWGHVLDLEGDNNNSEWRFFGCMTNGLTNDGAFLYIGEENTSDQFLNFWFYGFKHWSTGASLIDAARGGHFHLFGVDASNWGKTLTETNHLFKLRGGTHARGVTSMSVHGLRVEGTGPHAALIYSEWPEGNVTIQCDWSSQTPWVDYGDIIHLNIANTAGAIYHFHDSYLAGGVRVSYKSGAHRSSQRIGFQDCNWTQRLTPSEVVAYDETGANGANVRPAVEFRGCRGVDNQNARGARGVSVWDATVGRGPLVRDAPKRSLMVQGVYGNLRDADGRATVHLPVGAVVTGCAIVGDTPGVWEVSTTEQEPRVIATTDEDNPPFRCTTRDQATITVKSHGVTKTNHDVFLLVEGYW